MASSGATPTSFVLGGWGTLVHNAIQSKQWQTVQKLVEGGAPLSKAHLFALFKSGDQLAYRWVLTSLPDVVDKHWNELTRDLVKDGKKAVLTDMLRQYPDRSLGHMPVESAIGDSMLAFIATHGFPLPEDPAECIPVLVKAGARATLHRKVSWCGKFGRVPASVLLRNVPDHKVDWVLAVLREANHSVAE